MESARPPARSTQISGRELFICDGFVDTAFVPKLDTVVRTLRYQRKEKSRPDVPPSAASADIADPRLP